MLTAYIIGCVALIIKPGPDLMCTLATALSDGKARAATLMAGLVLGCWLWIWLLAAGVASFFTSHPTVMTAIQIVGIVYIGYLRLGRSGRRGRDFGTAAKTRFLPQLRKAGGLWGAVCSCRCPIH